MTVCSRSHLQLPEATWDGYTPLPWSLATTLPDLTSGPPFPMQTSLSIAYLEYLISGREEWLKSVLSLTRPCETVLTLKSYCWFTCEEADHFFPECLPKSSLVPCFSVTSHLGRNEFMRFLVLCAAHLGFCWMEWLLEDFIILISLSLSVLVIIWIKPDCRAKFCICSLSCHFL